MRFFLTSTNSQMQLLGFLTNTCNEFLYPLRKQVLFEFKILFGFLLNKVQTCTVSARGRKASNCSINMTYGP